jgi:hypothetical protein
MPAWIFMGQGDTLTKETLRIEIARRFRRVRRTCGGWEGLRVRVADCGL